jgi:hypothetical protein
MNFYSMKVGFTPTTNGRPKGISIGQCCSQCGYVWPRQSPDFHADRVREHMIKEHGFKQVGAQVFRSYSCMYCDKPALYKVGSDGGYCKDHVEIGKDRLRWRAEIYSKFPLGSEKESRVRIFEKAFHKGS